MFSVTNTQKKYIILPSRKRTIVREIYFLPRVFQRNFSILLFIESNSAHLFIWPYFVHFFGELNKDLDYKKGNLFIFLCIYIIYSLEYKVFK